MTPSGGQPLETPVLIAHKRDGGELREDQLRGLVEGLLDGTVSEAQFAALLMAGVLRGFSRREATALTRIYVGSGGTVDLAALAGPTVDKHSTGGVGDTTTLIVGPLAAACGLQVVKLSGRGLGHTGGTLDKLQAIPGLRVDLAAEEVLEQAADVGVVIAAATADLVPADKRIYALRDVTATVPSPALIAASVMSKKLAGGAQHLVIDVKVGDGAFVADVEEARALAELCVAIGEAHGRRTTVLLTDMSQPLGDAVGNALEVAAAVEVLAGRRRGRLAELSVALTAALLELTGVDPGEATRRARAALDAGDGLERFARLVQAQGGDPRVAEDPWSVLPAAPVVVGWNPPPGTVTSMACRRLGELATRLGAGRLTAGDVVDPAVGLDVRARVGDEVGSGAPAVVVHARTEADAQAVVAELAGAVEVSTGPAPAPSLVLERVGGR